MPALKLVADVLGMGATKYGRYNYRAGMEWTRYYAAALRHLAAWAEREDLDSESNLPHLAHAAANCLMLLQNILDGVGTDTRYHPEVSNGTSERTIVADPDFVPTVYGDGWQPPS